MKKPRVWIVAVSATTWKYRPALITRREAKQTEETYFESYGEAKEASDEQQAVRDKLNEKVMSLVSNRGIVIPIKQKPCDK